MNTAKIRKIAFRIKQMNHPTYNKMASIIFMLTGEIDRLRVELSVVECELEKHWAAQEVGKYEG